MISYIIWGLWWLCAGGTAGGVWTRIWLFSVRDLIFRLLTFEMIVAVWRGSWLQFLSLLIAHISHHRHHQQWCTFFVGVFFSIEDDRFWLAYLGPFWIICQKKCVFLVLQALMWWCNKIDKYEVWVCFVLKLYRIKNDYCLQVLKLQQRIY